MQRIVNELTGPAGARRVATLQAHNRRHTMRKNIVPVAALTLLLTALAPAAWGSPKPAKVTATLRAYEEVPAISTPAVGSFTGTFNSKDNPTSIHYTLK